MPFDGDADSHPVRRAIVDVLAQGPLLLSELVAALGDRAGRVRHHVAALQRAGGVVQWKFLGQNALCLPGTDPRTALESLVARDPRLRAVRETEHAGMDRPAAVRALSERFGVQERTARKYIQRYERLGLAGAPNEATREPEDR